MKAARQVDLQDLIRRMRAIEGQSVDAVHSAATLTISRSDESTGDTTANVTAMLSTGWPVIDAMLGGGLPRGALHEWFGLQTPSDPICTQPNTGYKPVPHTPVVNRRHKEPWSPPLSILAHLAWQAAGDADAPPWTLWIGPQCFPYPHILTRCRGTDHRLLERSIFVRAENATERLWATELAVRCHAVGAVIVDGSQFSMPATRRLQLLARNHGCLVLAAHPAQETKTLSAAHSRWRVRWAMSEGAFTMPRWHVELLRCKGTRVEDRPGWILEQDRATGAIGISATLADATGEETPVARARALGG